MRKFKHTPGPWRVAIDDDGNPLSGRPSVLASEEIDCGIVHWDGFVQTYWRSARGDTEIHANAKLIAASPTMLDTLCGVREALEAIDPSRPLQYTEVMALVKAAIDRVVDQAT